MPGNLHSHSHIFRFPRARSRKHVRLCPQYACQALRCFESDGGRSNCPGLLRPGGLDWEIGRVSPTGCFGCQCDDIHMNEFTGRVNSANSQRRGPGSGCVGVPKVICVSRLVFLGPRIFEWTVLLDLSLSGYFQWRKRSSTERHGL